MVRRRARIRFEALPDDAPERLAGREPSPAQAYDDTHWDDDVQRALDALAPEFRAAVVLCDIEQLTYEEIADVLGIKLGTVRSRIHRGRTQLRAALEHRAPDRNSPATDQHAPASCRAPDAGASGDVTHLGNLRRRARRRRARRRRHDDAMAHLDGCGQCRRDVAA